MSKATDDLIDKIQGAATGLRGVKVKLSPPQPAAPPADVPPAQPKPEITQEDYDHAKKVIAEMKSTLDALEAEVSRDSKVPEVGGAPDSKSTITPAAEHDTKAKAKV
jgi:hypothetical protein